MMGGLLIADPSAMARAGLGQIARELGLFQSVVEHQEGQSVKQLLEQHAPQALAIGPALLTPELLGHIHEHCPALYLLAILYAPFDMQQMQPFADWVLITDGPERVRAKLVRAAGMPAHPPVGRATEAALSAREVDVLKLLVAGCSSKEISDQLYISPHTVVTHRKNITRKLKIRSVAGLTVYAILNNLTALDQVR